MVDSFYKATLVMLRDPEAKAAFMAQEDKKVTVKDLNPELDAFLQKCDARIAGTADQNLALMHK